MGSRIGAAGDGSSGAFERAGLAENDEVGETIVWVRPDDEDQVAGAER
jgi:hypothetical protein